MLHTRVMGWWGVGRLNKKFGGQVFFSSNFNFEGLGIAMFCVIMLSIWCSEGRIGAGTPLVHQLPADVTR